MRQIFFAYFKLFYLSGLAFFLSETVELDIAEVERDVDRNLDEVENVEEEAEKERAIDEIIKYDLLNVYIKVSKDLIIPDDDAEI